MIKNAVVVFDRGFVKRLDGMDDVDGMDGNGIHPGGERHSLRNRLSF